MVPTINGVQDVYDLIEYLKKQKPLSNQLIENETLKETSREICSYIKDKNL